MRHGDDTLFLDAEKAVVVVMVTAGRSCGMVLESVQGSIKVRLGVAIRVRMHR